MRRLTTILLPATLTGLVLVGAGLVRAEPGRVTPRARRVSLAATGDVLLHLAVVRSARAFADEGGWDRAFGGLAKAIGDDEIAIVNVETPLTESVIRPRKGDHPVLGAPPEVATALAKAGVDVASVANNHAYDQDSEGLALTMDALTKAGITPVGAGPSRAEAFRARIVERNGLRVAFVAATGPMNCRHRGRGEKLHVARLRQEEDLLGAVGDARKNADVVVVLLHWMWDYRTGPRRYERSLAQKLTSSGADVLLGAGPHLLHSVDRLASARGEALVAWSLGNLISAMGMRWRPGFRPPPDMHPVSVLPGTRDAVMLHFDVHVSNDERVRVDNLRATPIWTVNNHMRRMRGDERREDIRLIPMAEAPEAVRELRMAAIRHDLGPEVTVEQ